MQAAHHRNELYALRIELSGQAEQVGPRIGAVAEITHALSPAVSTEVLHALYRAVPDRPAGAEPPAT